MNGFVSSLSWGGLFPPPPCLSCIEQPALWCGYEDGPLWKPAVHGPDGHSFLREMESCLETLVPRGSGWGAEIRIQPLTFGKPSVEMSAQTPAAASGRVHTALLD